MKGKRLLATMLALLLVVSLLPMAAMADDNPAGTTITTTTEDIGTNNGKIENNNNTVENNVAVEKPSEEGEESPPSYQYGTGRIVNNNKVVETNGTQNGGAESGRIQSNNGTVGKEGNNASGNYGTVGINQNGGKVLINQSSGVVDMNQKGGTIETNNGIVGAQNQFGDAEPTSGNYGTVETNNGKVLINQAGGTVETNAASGIVETNKNGGTVVTNNGYVNKNSGEVVTNNRIIETNKGIVETNNRYIGNNFGTVNTNNIDGTVHNSNTKTLDDVVGTNFGEVNNCGVDGKIYYGLSWGDSVNSLNEIESFVKKGDERNLDKIASGVTRDGYKMTGYKAYERTGGKDSQITGDTTKYLMNAPVWLQILWEKIVTVVDSNEPEAKPVKAAALPSTVAAEDVKVGTVVRVKGQLFRVIEMDDGSMTVVTMGKLSGKDMEDPMAFLAKYFTPEQIELLLGDPELISGALAEELFGGNTNHIVFKAASNLFA